MIFSAVVATTTVVYALLTWKLVSETKRMGEAQTEPKVSVGIQPREEWINFIDMVIQKYRIRTGRRRASFQFEVK